MHVIAVIHANERYVFLWDDDPRSLLALLAVLATWMVDDDLDGFGERQYVAVVERVYAMTENAT